jgi:hypothetical protein
MKMLWKNQDRVIDNLLRASTKGRGGPDASCGKFDPDLANAYIERSLPARERAGYEGHLSECHACRSSVVALARMVEVEAAPLIRSQPDREAGRFATLKGLFTTPAMPRLAAAALAILVLAVGIPLLLSQEDSTLSGERAASEVAGDQTAKGFENSTASPLATARDTLRVDPTQASTAVAEEARTAKREQEKAAPAQGETDQPKPTPAEPETASAAGAAPARVEPPQPEKVEAKSVEARSAADSSGQTRKSESDAQAVAKEQPAAPPARVAEEQSPLGHINAEDARRLRRDDKDAVSVTIKPGRRGGVSGLNKEDRSAIRPGDAVAPPSQNSPAGSGERRGLAEPPRANRDEASTGSAGFAARGSAMRKVGSKKFWLFKDTWTDKDYNPDKEMPVVTIERDSDIYKEMLTKRSGLKLYLMSFVEGERAIIVYKGTVYRLVPQNSR